MKPPAFQFYPDDFLGGTVTMSHEERGLYILLLCVQWSHGGLLDDDFVRLGRGLVEPSLNHVRTKFERSDDDGLWRNPRLEQERAKQSAYRERQSNAGRRSVEARFNHGSTTVKPSGEPQVNSPSPSPSPSPIPISGTGTLPRPERAKFEVPTIEAVLLAAAKTGLPVQEAHKFFNHYSANGWRIGRNPMKSMPHALANWKLNTGNFGSQQSGNSYSRPPANETLEELKKRALHEAL